MKLNRTNRNRHGGTIILICILMLVLIGMVAFGVEVGRMYLVRSQLQSAVDSGALAASLRLQQDPDDPDAAAAAAQEFIQHNRVGWLVTVPEDAIDVTIGSWNAESGTFDSAGDKRDAVRVEGKLEDEPLMFASVFGHSSFSVPRSATAVAGGNKLDIIMTLDLSGSMGSDGRIEALRVAAPKFVDVIEDVGDDDRIGVMGYGAIPMDYNPFEKGHTGVPYMDAPAELYPPNSDWTAIQEAELTDAFVYLKASVLDSQNLVAKKYGGGTPIGASLRDSAHYLNANARKDVKKIVVLMSDGRANKPEDDAAGYARKMADYAAGLDITVHTISMGNSADEALMEDIARTTGGQHFLAKGSGNALTKRLTEAFHAVASELKQTQLVK